MKILLTISERTWKLQLRVTLYSPGRFCVTLRGPDGERLRPTPVIGGFESLDAILAHAPHLYRQLVAMHESNAATASINTRQKELTTLHAKEN